MSFLVHGLSTFQNQGHWGKAGGIKCRAIPQANAQGGDTMGQQVIKCSVDDCRHWAAGNNCDLREIWVERKPGSANGGLLSAIAGGQPAPHEQDTFCASFDAKR